jgi:hypothetical protein
MEGGIQKREYELMLVSRKRDIDDERNAYKMSQEMNACKRIGPRKRLWKLSVGPLFDPQTSPRSCFVTVKEMRKRKPGSKKDEIEGR